MSETRRQYKRTTFHVPFTYTTKEYPPVASKHIPVPKNEFGEVVMKGREGTIRNSSQDGFCFTAREAIAPGTQIQADINDQTPALTTGSKATVKWCSRVENELETAYFIGAKKKIIEPLPLLDFKKKSFASLKVF